ncbi:MAG: 2-oxoacid ferredoxin oxidoreductase [Candidatus Glassbacteria bacterium]|nr:2-oxoacid ferredoxin oxidoreductase [Candidatus Glassbacteria bacterium]
MVTAADYQGMDTTWCPGCGNFAILNALKQVLAALDLHPHQVVLYSGIGQAAKLPLYMKCNMLNGLHGRTLTYATASQFVDPEMVTIAVGGDGDGFAEGGNHFLHAIRRNPNMVYLAHNNQVYGLTKGQASPTSEHGMVTSTTPEGVYHGRFNPAAVAVALDCSWVGRTHTGDMRHMIAMMDEAINHRGFAMLEVMQPCVTYNKINTLKWYRERSYQLDEDGGFDPTDRMAAMTKAFEWGERFPIGLLYKNEKRPVMMDNVGVLADGPLNRREAAVNDVSGLLESFR